MKGDGTSEVGERRETRDSKGEEGNGARLTRSRERIRNYTITRKKRMEMFKRSNKMRPSGEGTKLGGKTRRVEWNRFREVGRCRSGVDGNDVGEFVEA